MLLRDAITDGKAVTAPQYDGKAALPMQHPKVIAPSAGTKGSCTTSKDGKTIFCDSPVAAPVRTAPRSLTAAPQTQASQKGSSQEGTGRDAVAAGIIPLPEFCYLFDYHGWLVFRTQACLMQRHHGTILKAETNAVIGTIDYWLIEYAFTSEIVTNWGLQIVISMIDGTGAGLWPGKVMGEGACLGSCNPPGFDLPSQDVEPGKFAVNQAYFSSFNLSSGSVGSADVYLTYQFLFTPPPGSGQVEIPVPLPASSPPEVRCDNALPGIDYAGCVFPEFEPSMQYDVEGEYPELAKHILAAQGSDLPGSLEGPALTRLTSKTQQDKNRDRSCPESSKGGYTRPDTKSCDEYPFASTYQGAYMQDPDGTPPARTFDWCQIPGVPTGSGSRGYSVCMIDAWQNSVGGNALGKFYDRNRVIDKDPFTVYINTGTGGGGTPHPPDHAPVVNAGPDVSGDEGDRIALHGTATDDSGPPTVHWTYRVGEDVDNGARCYFLNDSQADTSIHCTDDGTFTVTLSAADAVHDEPSSDSAVVHVANVDPRIRRATFLAAPANASAATTPTISSTSSTAAISRAPTDRATTDRATTDRAAVIGSGTAPAASTARTTSSTPARLSTDATSPTVPPGPQQPGDIRRSPIRTALHGGTANATTAGADTAEEPDLGIVSPQPWQVFRVGDEVTLTTNFTDPGENDTHSCVIGWDDGTSTSGAAAGYVCGGKHRYTHAGMYTIKPTITDDDNGSAEPTSVLIVVYDPAGPWANADGSYDSPAGALTSAPDTALEGWFHLTGRYYPQNTSKPEGAARSWLPGTTYQFDTGASTLDWLVVTPDGKVAAKGSGTLAGHTGAYGFVLYAYDGCSAGGTPQACQPGIDRIRAVVWPLSSGPYPGRDTVYDNNAAGGYDVDEAGPTALRSGAVLIQQPN